MTTTTTTTAAVIGGVGQYLQPEQVTEFVAAAIADADIENKRVCLVVPDGTRPAHFLCYCRRCGRA